MEMVKKILKIALSWPALLVEGVALVIICWPWCNHWVSVFWTIIILGTLLGEWLNYIYSPKKQTVSNNIQDQITESPVRFWLMIIVWLGFALTLAGHFMIKGM